MDGACRPRKIACSGASRRGSGFLPVYTFLVGRRRLTCVCAVLAPLRRVNTDKIRGLCTPVHHMAMLHDIRLRGMQRPALRSIARAHHLAAARRCRARPQQVAARVRWRLSACAAEPNHSQPLPATPSRPSVDLSTLTVDLRRSQSSSSPIATSRDWLEIEASSGGAAHTRFRGSEPTDLEASRDPD